MKVIGWGDKGAVSGKPETPAMERLNRRETAAEHRRILRGLGADLRRMREDAGHSQRAVARAAGIAQPYLSEIEAGGAEPSVEVLHRLGVVLGAQLSLRFFPNTGPRVRDHLQLLMEQTMLRALDRRWRAEIEVPVYRPVRGVVDLILHDLRGPDSVVTEAHSLLARVEQQIRWANEKADAVAGLPGFGGRRVCRLLLLRNTSANRDVVRSAPQVFEAAYPGRASDAYDALTQESGRFPDAALLWVEVRGTSSRLLARPPRGVGVGR